MDEKEIKNRLKSAREGIQNKNFNDALKICEEILKAKPFNYMALVFAGRCQVELDNPSAAREYYSRAASADESQLLAWQGLLQLYEKYCIWDDNCVSCLRRLITLTSEEKKKRDYQFQLATTLAKGGRLNESAAEFSLLCSSNGDDAWRIQIEEAVIRLFGEAVLANSKEIEMVNECFQRVITRTVDAEKLPLNLRFSHFLVQNHLYADAYELYTRVGLSKDHGITFLCDFATLLCEKFLQDTFTESDEELLAELDDCFEDGLEATGNGPISVASTAVSALNDFISENWSEVIERLKPEKLRLLKAPFLWYLLSASQFRVHCYFDAVAAAEEAQRGWQYPHYQLHRLKAAHIEASSHLEIGTPASIQKALAIYKDILYQLRDSETKSDRLEISVQLGFVNALAADGHLNDAVDALKNVKDQSTPDYFLTKAFVYLRFSMYSECKLEVDQVRKILDDADDGIKAKLHYLNGRILWDTDEDRNSAFKEFLQAAKLDPYHADSYYYIAQYYDQLNDSKFDQKALKVYERAYALDGRYKWKFGCALSDAYRKSGAHDKNLALLLDVTKSQPAESSSWAWLRLGLEYLSEGKADEAVRVLQTVLRLVDTEIRCWECLGEAYAIRGSYASAVKTFEKVLELESEPSKVAYTKYRMAMINLVMQRYESAADGFRNLSKEDQGHLSSVVGLGHSLVELAKHYFSEARYQRSLDVCVEAVDILAPVVISNAYSLSCWYLLGSALTMTNRFPESELPKMAFPDFKTLFNDPNFKIGKSDLLKLGSRCFAQAIRLNAKVPEIWHELGMNLFFRSSVNDGEKEAAEELLEHSLNCLKHAVSLDPLKSKLWSSLANVAASSLVDQPELAQHCFIKALSLEPHHASAWTGLGILYKKYYDIQLAHKCFERAQSIDPDYANCWIGQAIIAEEVQPEEALDLFRHAVELGNNVQGFLGYGYHVLSTMLDPDIDRAGMDYQYAIEHLRAVPVAQVALHKYCYLNPLDACALNMLGLLFDQEKMLSSASTSYMSALDVLRKSPSVDEHAEEFVAGNACRLFGKLGNSAMIRKLAGKMTTKDSFDNLCMRGLAYYRLGQFDKAVEMYNQAVYASETKFDQTAVNCAFSFIGAKQNEWKKTAELENESSMKEYAPWIFWSSISSLLETGFLDMKRIRSGFMQLSKLPASSEWQTILASACCLYCEKLSLVNVQWLLHLLPFDVNVRFAFNQIWRHSELEWSDSKADTGIHALAKWQAVTQLKESRKEVTYAKIKHVYPDLLP